MSRRAKITRDGSVRRQHAHAPRAPRELAAVPAHRSDPFASLPSSSLGTRLKHEDRGELAWSRPLIVRQLEYDGDLGGYPDPAWLKRAFPEGGPEGAAQHAAGLFSVSY
jgi:hypothetical protein